MDRSVSMAPKWGRGLSIPQFSSAPQFTCHCILWYTQHPGSVLNHQGLGRFWATGNTLCTRPCMISTRLCSCLHLTLVAVANFSFCLVIQQRNGQVMGDVIWIVNGSDKDSFSPPQITGSEQVGLSHVLMIWDVLEAAALLSVFKVFWILLPNLHNGRDCAQKCLHENLCFSCHAYPASV